MAIRSRPPTHVAATKRRHARIPSLYNLCDRVLKPHYRPGRALIGAQTEGLTLEVGAGTGKNFPHYPDQVRVIASDLSEATLAQAREKVRPPVRALLVAEAAALPLRDSS